MLHPVDTPDGEPVDSRVRLRSAHVEDALSAVRGSGGVIRGVRYYPDGTTGLWFSGGQLTALRHLEVLRPL